MAIGAHDYIDKLLVKKYADEKVDNHECIESAVPPEKLMSAMNNHAMMSRNMFALKQKLNQVCYSLKAANATYCRAASFA